MDVVNVEPVSDLVVPTGRESMRTAGRRRRPMIAVLIHYVETSPGGYEQSLRQAFKAACQNHDFDFTIVSGGALDHASPEARVYNPVYDLVKAEHFDGAILLPSAHYLFHDLEALSNRLQSQEGLALCSLGVQLPGVPSIVTDNRVGMAAAVEHLITVHGRRNLAFLGSEANNSDIEQRRDVFFEVTARHGLEIPEHRLLKCWLEPTSAEVAVAALLEQDRSIDGIVAANDGAALGAIRALERVGLSVPQQVSVTGYDNLPQSLWLKPSLTTVAQPLAEMATIAVEVIAEQLAGKQPKSVTSLPTALIIRHSCGAHTETNQMPTPGELSEAADRAYVERMDLESMYGRILEMARRCTLAYNRPELEQQVAFHLPRILSRDAFVGLFADERRSQFRPLLPQRDPSGPLLPPADASFLEQLGSQDHPRALLVLGLALRTQLLGVIGFELGEQSVDYGAVRDHLVSAWQVVTLHEEVVKQSLVTERSIQEKQAAADRNRAMSALAAGVAHDLNNALGSLVSLSDVVRDEIEEHFNTLNPVNPEVIDDLRTMKVSALRATETIKDLMTLGRIGRTRHEPFDLVRLTRRLIEEQKEAMVKAHAPPMVLSLEAPERDLVVTGSEPHVERAVGNILRNAMEAVNRRGQVDVTVTVTVLDRTFHGYESIPPGNYAVVCIADNGPGIDVDSQKRLFEPFFSTKRLGESSGSGLGLAIVHSVIKEHQGYIDVASQLGIGSRFALYLPKAGSVGSARPSPVPVVGGSARILVVDDDLTQLRTAKRVLTRLGYDVTTMASGAQAYEIIALEASQNTRNSVAPQTQSTQANVPRSTSSGYDLLILDLALNEDEDGLEIFNKIRQLFPDQKAILASGHAFVDHEEQIHAGNLVWLPKPYTIESLTNAIRVALRA